MLDKLNFHDKLKQISQCVLVAIIAYCIGYMSKPSYKKESTSVRQSSESNKSKASSSDSSSAKAGSASKISINKKGIGKKAETNIVIDNAQGFEISQQLLNELSNEQSKSESSMKHEIIEKRTSWGFGAMVDFDKENKHEGYVLDGFYGPGKAAVDLDQEARYNGWKIGLQFTFK